MADLISGVVTAAGILAELVGRFRTGAGSRVETSMFESVSALTIDSMTQLFETGVPPSRVKLRTVADPSEKKRFIAIPASDWNCLSGQKNKPGCGDLPRGISTKILRIW